MLIYTLRRLAGQVIVLLVASLVIFGLLRLAPGDETRAALGNRAATEQEVQKVRAKYGLDEPIPKQYLTWLSGSVRGDFGESMSARTPVSELIGPRVTTTLLLTIYASIIMIVLGIGIGILGAVFRNGPIDVAVTTGSLMFVAIPAYVTGLVFILIFGVQLRWFPTLGAAQGESLAQQLYHLTLPAIALALSAMALISRVTRSSMIAALDSEHVEGARIRGFGQRRVVGKHALRSALVPVVTIAGVQCGALLAGGILVEQAFGLNGLGALLVESVENHDYPVVEAITLMITCAFLVISLIVDLLYGVIDPRVRVAKAAS